MVHFNSLKSYLSFVTATSFYDQRSQSQWKYEKNWLDQMGSWMLAPVSQVLDCTLRNIRNPLVILALTVSLIALATLAFYPTLVLSTVGTLMPMIFAIQPWMIKLTCFSFVQLTILATGLRTLGRLSQPDLLERWVKKEIISIYLGTQLEQL